MKISLARRDLKEVFPLKNSLSFIRLKACSVFHLPMLYLGLQKTNKQKALKQR